MNVSTDWARPIFIIAYRLPVLNLPPCPDHGGACQEDVTALVVTAASKN